MDSIIEKARKVLALVEQGVEGEAQAAKFALEALLKKHGLTIEDLKNEKRERREFSIKSRNEILIFNHCILNMFGHSSAVWGRTYTYKRDYRHVYAEMTDIEYLDFKPFFEFHIKQFRKELKKMIEATKSAYINRQNLFDPNSSQKEDDRKTSNIDMQELYRIIQIMDSMESASYHKILSE
jgi:hypothetical protein